MSQRTPCLGGPGKDALAALDAWGDDYGKPLYPSLASRLCGRNLEICAGSGRCGEAAVGCPLELPNRGALFCAPSAASDYSLSQLISASPEKPPL